MKTIQKTVTISGIKTKVSFKTQHVKTTVLIDNKEIENDPKKIGVFKHTESIILFVINNVSYEVKRKLIQRRIKPIKYRNILKDRSYDESYTYNSLSVPNSEKKIIEHILNN